MQTVFVGGISPEGEHLLTSYLNVFVPDAKIEPLKAVGIKSKVKNHVARIDCILCILDEVLYQECAGVASLLPILQSNKVHKYVDDDGLKEFLISKFGRLDGIDTEVPDVIPPDQLLNQQEIIEEEDYTPKSADIFTTPDNNTPAPDQLSSGLINSVVEDDVNLAVTVDEITEKESEDALINELKSKLAKSELLVRNLTLQLEDKGADDDIKAFISRIQELESLVAEKEEQLAKASEESYVQIGKVAKAEELIKEVSGLKSEIKRIKEDKANITYERDKFSNSAELLTKEVEELKTQVVQISELEAELDAKSKELADMQEKLSGVEEQYNITVADLDEANKLLEAKETELSDVRSELEEAKKSLETMDSLSSDITEQIDELNKELEEANETIKTLNKSVADKDAEISDKTKALETATQNIEAKENELSETLDLVETLTSEKEELEKSLDELKKLREENEAKIADLENQIAQLNKVSENKSEQMEDLDNQLEELANSVVERDEKIAELERQIEELNGSNTAITESESGLKSQVEELTSDLEQSRGRVSELEEQVSELQSEIESLNSQITGLTESIGVSESDDEKVIQLQETLEEERKKSAKLESELELAKSNSDTSKSSELRLEVARLKNELSKAKRDLENAKDSADNSSEIEALNEELLEARKRCGELELDIEEQQSVIDEISEGIFGKMANIAMPKVPYNLSLSDISGEFTNFICLASGSQESSTIAYSALRKSCTTNATKHILIIDLVTDSTIDREFGINKVVSPISWLSGSEEYKKFMAATRFNNVRVLSTALAYLNDLYLLKVDWQRRLEELQGSADTVVINIGCLNNLVSKVLFNSFSKVMKTYIVTKATPINLRTVMLNLTGITDISRNVTVECVNFDEKASRNMYQRLVAKYKAQILKDTDVLQL